LRIDGDIRALRQGEFLPCAADPRGAAATRTSVPSSPRLVSDSFSFL
jgi:hypothetical protein